MIKRAIENEYNRQVSILENNEKFSMQTRGRDDTKGESYMMRSKEDALDYRYFPEPDMPPLILDDTVLQTVKEMELTIPYQIIKKFKQEYDFHKEYINALISDQETLNYFLNITHNINDIEYIKTVAKWIVGPINAYMKDNFVSINDLKFNKEQFVEFIQVVSG